MSFDPAQYRKEKEARIARGERKHPPEPANPSGPPAFDPAVHRANREARKAGQAPVVIQAVAPEQMPTPAVRRKKAE